ncbi:MAG TPA: Wadjet anti-phage system protein JetD domain-containing protein [Microbacterium sp.]|uniref:Wadjet anti-phage system protein JetD domain-containing protein n=1 Tax=Microbacterium sp. TaxID=51671 RepID=UPI002B49D068|nr:Wadjet anti-phage system protein JetD domain-containing protein [Microbacterium sp.]HKT56566.1 Wadjet anti-phage system protein JetD domain-containing protein [Microbacterium sp.]
MTDPARWTGLDGIRDAVRRRWVDGTLPRAFAVGDPFPTIDVPLRHPSAADLGEHFDAARGWVDAVVHGSREGRAYAVQSMRIGGRLVGATQVPARAVVSTYAQAWQLLGTAASAELLRELVAMSAGDPVPRDWALAHPQDAIAVADEWAAMLAAHRWLVGARGTGQYLRQVAAPRVDTKFIERHRGPLAEMLGVSATATGFTRDLGLTAKPQMVRMRFDPAVFGFPPALSEMSLRVDELQAVSARPADVLIVENEITYLSVPVRPRGVVLWGKGYDADQPASLPWLADVPVRYWGDLDTHGFGILNRVRAWLPHARSILMDRETLLRHRARWVAEGTPTNAALPRLDAAEQSLYDDLVTDRFGPAVRLEQERIDWEWALERLG